MMYGLYAILLAILFGSAAPPQTPPAPAASRSFRLTLTGVVALVPASYDPKNQTYTFPIKALLPDGIHASVAKTQGVTPDDQVIPAHHSILRIKHSDLAAPPDPDFSAHGFDYYVVDGQSLTLPAFIQGAPSSSTSYPVPKGVIDFAQVCDIAAIQNQLMTPSPPPAVSARIDLPEGKWGYTPFDPAFANHTMAFRPSKDHPASPKDGATLALDGRPWISWDIPAAKSIEITSKPIHEGKARSWRFNDPGTGDIDVLLANVPPDSLLNIAHLKQEADTHFELYYRLFDHKKSAYHIPWVKSGGHPISVLCCNGGGDCGVGMIQPARAASTQRVR